MNCSRVNWVFHRQVPNLFCGKDIVPARSMFGHSKSLHRLAIKVGHVAKQTRRLRSKVQFRISRFEDLNAIKEEEEATNE